MRLSKYRTTPEQKRRFYQMPMIRYPRWLSLLAGSALPDMAAGCGRM